MMYLSHTLIAPARAAEPESVELSFFEYLGSMVEDEHAGWIDPLDLLDGVAQESVPTSGFDDGAQPAPRQDANLPREAADAEAEVRP